MDVLGRSGPECLVELLVELLVRPVVVPAVDMRDSEVRVVDDARQVVGGRAVLAEERRPAEAVAAQLLGGLPVAFLPLALAHGPLVPANLQPSEVAQDRVLAARQVAGRVGVIDPQEQMTALAPVDDRAQPVTDVKRAGWAGREAHALHRPNVTAARPASRGGRFFPSWARPAPTPIASRSLGGSDRFQIWESRGCFAA